MAPRRRDPFKGVNLDDEFVRDARFIEPSAAQRTGAAGSPGTAGPPTSTRERVLARVRRSGGRSVPARRAVDGAVRRVGRLRRSRRRLARFLALVVLLLGIAVAGVLLMIRQGSGRPGHPGRLATPGGPAGTRDSTRAVNTFAPGPGPSAIDPALDAILAPGTCLNWIPLAGGRTATRPVDCDRPHRDEVTAVLDLRSAGYATWPGPVPLLGLAETRCVAALTDYRPPATALGTASVRAAAAGSVVGSGTATPGTSAPDALIAAAAYPDEPAWRAGSRHLACTARRVDGGSWTGTSGPAATRPAGRPAVTRPPSSAPSDASVG